MKNEDRMKLGLPPKLVEKLVWVQVISLCKIFIPNYMFGCVFLNCSGTQMCLPIVFAKLLDFKGPSPLDHHVTI